MRFLLTLALLLPFAVAHADGDAALIKKLVGTHGLTLQWITFAKGAKGSATITAAPDGKLPLTIQAKILRTLQHNEIRRIGGEHTITGDARFIAATNKPLEQFAAWFADARRIKGLEPNAMTLATASADGRPSARVVLLKEFDASGLVWYTNYDSRKGAELDANPVASLLFFWAPLERQVRVEGRVEKVTPEESDAYYAVRPLDSRIGAWASPQPQVIANRGVLVGNAARAAAEHGLPPRRPDHWGGYRLVPEVWEFWQGRTSRLHDRLRYRLEGGDWVRERLAP